MSGWIGLVAALLAFIGGFIIARINNAENLNRLEKQLNHDAERQTKQLAHDAEQRRLERERDLQREVYLGAAEAVAKWQNYMLSLADTSLPIQEQNQVIRSAAEQISKAYIIGEVETLKALDKLNVFFSEKSLYLIEKRLEVTLSTSRVSLIEGELQAARERATQLTSAAQTAQQNGNYNLATSFLTLFQSQQKRIDEVQSSLTKATKERDTFTIELAATGSRVANEFAVLSFDAILPVRRELGMSLSEDLENELRESAIKTAEKIYENWCQWLKNIQQRLNEEFYQEPK